VSALSAATRLGRVFIVQCEITNVSDKPGELTEMTVVSNSGVPLQTEGSLTVSPGATVQTNPVSLSAFSPSYCTFRFQGKFRGSLVYMSGTEVEVIPATK
jgi:hypothetical protein